MSRIVSNSTFAVNSNLEQLVSVANTSLNVADTTAQGSLSTIAGAVAGTEMQVDIVSAPTLNVSDSAAQASLTTLAGAVSGSEVQVDIVSSSGTISTSDSAAQASLSTLAGAVSGSEVQVDIVSSSGTISTSDSAAQSSLGTIAGAVSGSEMQVDIVSSATLPVSMTNANNSGSSGNLVNAASKASGDFSSEVDTRNAKNITITGVTTDTSANKIELFTAHTSGGTKFKISFDIYPDSNGNFFEKLDGIALNYLSLKFSNSTPATVTATALFN